MIKSFISILLITGFFSPVFAQDWFGGDAQWISPAYAGDSAGAACPVFRKTFAAKNKISRATLFITAHGLYEAEINGQRVGERYLTPGWTNYNKRLLYQSYDVTGLLKKNNEIVVTVADGWYRGAFGHLMAKNNYGTDASLLCQLVIQYADSPEVSVNTDNSWSCTTGPIRYADFYAGEIFDANFQMKKGGPVLISDFPKDIIVATTSEPVTRQETFAPKKIFTNAAAETIVDFGQNMAGFVQIRVKGRKGDTIKIHHSELLDKNENFYTGNLREATATDIYILSGQGTETFEPHFGYHGFRYIKVEGFMPDKNNCTAIALHNNLKHTGSFECSDTLINQLQHNIQWSLNSNFVDVPTDCPQRSERLGWTGDAQIFFRTASFNRDVKSFFEAWLVSMRTDQEPTGLLPVIIPDIYHLKLLATEGVGGWGDASAIIPWEMFQVYGDTMVLRDSYMSMKGWVDYIKTKSPLYLWTVRGYGDTYAPGEPTSVAYIDQCFWAYSTQLLVNTATVLGKTEDVKTYSELLEKIKTAFTENYLSGEGLPLPGTQTSCVLALQFDMVPASLKPKIAGRLVELIHNNNDHLATGFLGTPYLLHILTEYGYNGLAYTLLNQQTSPSWLYPVKMGATTIWERWDAIRPQDSSIQECSFNHYAYGAVGDWLYRVVAGIGNASPGYEKIIIKPFPGGGLTYVKASYEPHSV